MRHLVLILILICGASLMGCKGSKQTARTGPLKSDVDFAKEVFQLLADGDEAVVELLDWEHLKVPGVADAGAYYRGIEDEDGRDRFRKGFIRSYANSFKNSGGKVENASNWREQSRDSSNTVVAVDNPNGKVMLITVTHMDGQQKVSAFELK